MIFLVEKLEIFDDESFGISIFVFVCVIVFDCGLIVSRLVIICIGCTLKLLWPLYHNVINKSILQHLLHANTRTHTHAKATHITIDINSSHKKKFVIECNAPSTIRHIIVWSFNHRYPFDKLRKHHHLLHVIEYDDRKYILC